MIINRSAVQGSINRWKRLGGKKAADLAKEIGETDRSKHTKPGQTKQRYAAILGQTGNAVVAHDTIERMLGGNDLVGINYLQLGTLCPRPVCRIH